MGDSVTAECIGDSGIGDIEIGDSGMYRTEMIV